MAEIGIFNGERTKWIQFDVDTEILIKLITKAELRKINQKAAKKAKFTEQNVNDVADNLLGQAVVKGWRKIKDHEHPGITVDKKPLPFTPENIDMLMTGSIKFSRFVNEACINEDEFIDDGEEIKND
ncbi:MAG: hypothetical protein HZA14_12490 [Nitrospirae bacterium]|nr:hypothetical protein [Nitrospirota bacterium]